MRQSTQVLSAPAVEPVSSKLNSAETLYTDLPDDFLYQTLQQNLQNCLAIIDSEVMKDYMSSLQSCEVVPLEEDKLKSLQQIQFFRITELVYQEDEFSPYKLATVFNALSSKPCTLVLMIQSDGQTNNFYLGVRSRDEQYSTGTMRRMLEQSLLGLFPGSNIADHYNEELTASLEALRVGCVSSVSCIADYKQGQDPTEDKSYVQGLEKFVYSMQGKAYTAVCIANNIQHQELLKTRREYERIYTLLSPFANMQYNFSINKNASVSQSDMQGQSDSTSDTMSASLTETKTIANAQSNTTNSSYSENRMRGSNMAATEGNSHTVGAVDGWNDSTTETSTAGTYVGVGTPGGPNAGVSVSTSESETHGTSHSDSVSDAVSRSLTYGLTFSDTTGNTKGQSQGTTKTISDSTGTQQTKGKSLTSGTSSAQTKALTAAFGNSQAVTLNVQNRELVNALQRLEKQMERLDECESIGMWDFAAYFLAESAAEAESAANMYRSLVSGGQSGLEMSAVNTWVSGHTMAEVAKYVTNFMHPQFLYEIPDNPVAGQLEVDPAVIASTNELAIQLGLPRKSVKGLPVIEHAVFAQEILSYQKDAESRTVNLGKIHHLGRETETDVCLDPQSMTMHTFITGSTGTGKSNTVCKLLDELCFTAELPVRFLVIEPAKGEYKDILDGCPGVSVYGTNPKKAPLLRLNPFSFPEDAHILEHIDRLVEVFNACWPMYAAMPAVLKGAIEQAYVNCGWSLSMSTCATGLFPTFLDVMRALPAIVDSKGFSGDTQGDYKGALLTRLESLTNGINGQVLCANDELGNDLLFDRNVIVDLSRVGSSETKALLMGILVLKLQEYRMAQREEDGQANQELRHVTVLEEAHNLLRRTATEQSQESSNLQGKSVEMLTNAIAEMRTYGEGFIIADQAPGLLDMAVIRNTNTKIIMRLPEESDRELVGKAAGLNEDQTAELAKLDIGVAAVFQNHWLEPVLCKVDKFAGGGKFVYDPSSQAPSWNTDALFRKILFGIKEREELMEETVDALKQWIDTLDAGPVPKRQLVDCLQGKQLSEDEKQEMLYCLVKGKTLIQNEEGSLYGDKIRAATTRQSIMDRLHVSDDLAAEIRKDIFSYAIKLVKEDSNHYQELKRLRGIM